MKIVINEGEVVPHYPWYLPAYDEFRLIHKKALVVCYPIGIHLVVMYFRKLVHWMHWNCRALTRYDELDHANNVIEDLKEDNIRLRKIATESVGRSLDLILKEMKENNL